MKNAWRYLAVGMAAYVVILVVDFPAGFIQNKLQDALPGLVLGNVSGSVFAGQSSPAAFRDMELGKLEWQFRPLSLFMLRAEYRLTFSHPDNDGQVDISISPGGQVVGRNLDIQMAPDNLVNRFSPMEMQTRGTFVLALESFDVRDEQLREVTGSAAWRDAAIESPVVVPLGKIALALESRDETLVGTVTEGGEIGLSGEVSLLPAGRYMLDLVLQPGGGFDDGARNLLATMLQSHPSGGFQVKTTGSLR